MLPCPIRNMEVLFKFAALRTGLFDNPLLIPRLSSLDQVWTPRRCTGQAVDHFTDGVAGLCLDARQKSLTNPCLGLFGLAR